MSLDRNSHRMGPADEAMTRGGRNDPLERAQRDRRRICAPSEGGSTRPSDKGGLSPGGRRGRPSRKAHEPGVKPGSAHSSVLQPINDFFEFYVDDMGVGSDNWSRHKEHVRRFLDIMRQHVISGKLLRHVL